MKAIQISGERQMNVVNVEEQELHAGEVLLRLEYVGFCGSDLNTWRGRNGMAKPEAIPGHDIVTTIDAALQQYGQELMQNKVGSVVAIEPSTGEILALVSSPGIDVDQYELGHMTGSAGVYVRAISDKVLQNFVSVLGEAAVLNHHYRRTATLISRVDISSRLNKNFDGFK